MANSPPDYVNLIRASGTKHPISSLLNCVVDNGVTWAALVTTSGNPIETATSVVNQEVEPQELQDAVDSIECPPQKPVTRRSATGMEILAFPVGAEGRATSVLILANRGSLEPEIHGFGASTAQLLRLLLRDTRRLQSTLR